MNSKAEAQLIFSGRIKGVSGLAVLKSQTGSKGFSTQNEALELLWCIRALEFCVRSNSAHRFLNEGQEEMNGFDDLLAACAQLDTPGELCSMMQLVQHAPALQQQLKTMRLPLSPIERSIDVLGEHCAISPAEKKLLLFGITIHENALVESVFGRCFRRVSAGLMFKILAFVLEETPADIQAGLRSDSFLSRAGMLVLDTKNFMDIEGRIELGFDLSATFEMANGNWQDMVCGVCVPARDSSLAQHDFGHMAAEWELVLAYLNGCSRSGRIGANVLLHGRPGCGKTEFARAVMAASEASGYEVIYEKLDGASLSPDARRSYYQQSSHYLEHVRPSILLVDEMDGMLEVGGSLPNYMGGNSRLSKAAANALLETNPVPTIWISNSVEQLDSAQVRRFDLVIELHRPARAAIQAQLQKHMAPFALSNSWLRETATAEQLTPGLVHTLALVAESVQNASEPVENLEKMLTTAIEQRGITVKRSAEEPYCLKYCNASMMPTALANTLRAKDNARCLLYGSTGTGKTAFAAHIARVLDLEARMVRPSDILNPYIGGTERNIARLFKDTSPKDTLIILDEFDSLAADRKGARHTWEVSRVNELLTQLEGYEGRVMACTNLLDYIDPAIRRRFQLKVKLLPLNPVQCSDLLKEACCRLGIEIKRGQHLGVVAKRLDRLSYGHVANALEVAEHQPGITLEDFSELLLGEIEATSGRQSRPIGFMQ